MKAGPVDVTVEIAPRGFATSFPDQDTPQEFSAEFLNLFTNAVGQSEKRQGIEELFSSITTKITVTNLHELIDTDGNALLFASGGGQIWLLDDGGSHTLVYTFENTAAKIFSFHAARRLIFYNGVNRNVYTTDGTSFSEMLSILEVGTAVSAAGVSAVNIANRLEDPNIASWLGTDVATRDLVYYTEVSAFGLITSITTASINHTTVSASAGGLGAGVITSGSRYAIIDTVELNIIPVSGLGFQTDNTGVLTTGSSAAGAVIGGISDWSDTEARVGDFIYNETRAQVSQLVALASAATVSPTITSQAAGDTVHLLKSSAPICQYGVAHFQRAYMIDARDPQKLRISSPGDPEDWGSLNAGTYDISTQQPASERFRQLLSFQRFLIVGGSRHLFAFQGTDPIGVISPDDGSFLLVPDWTDLGLFPSGTLSRTGMVNAGNDLHWVTNNGVRSATLAKTTNQLTETQISVQLDKTLRELFKRLSEDEIVAVHYPRRNWVLFKAGDELYVFNYARAGQQAKAFVEGQEVSIQVPPAWHLFDGHFAQQKCFFVRENGDLICGGVNGQINVFDLGEYSDLGQPIRTKYKSAWHGFEKRQQKSTNRKHGKYIKPIWEAPEGTSMTVKVRAPYKRDSSDEIEIEPETESVVIGQAVIGDWIIGGNDVTFEKHPLRWNGEVAQFEFETEHTSGPYVLSGYTVFYSQFGGR